MTRCPHTIGLICVSLLLASPAPAQQQEVANDDPAISEITVTASRVANTRPAATYASPTTMLRYDPLTELQSRGLPEGQADVTVRGGLFENTGFKVGAVTIMDPQTGHYAAELPFDPASISRPRILTGIDNALAGFNSNIATIAYSLPAVASGGAARLGAGSDDLRFGSLRVAGVRTTAGGADFGVALSGAASAGDGTVQYGDHEFARYNLQLQRSANAVQTDLIIAYQDKFYGWPGAYTGFATLPETDDTQTLLLLANHRAMTASGWWQVGAFHRRLEDDYDFDRTTQESGAPGSFDHETRVSGVGIEGASRRGNVEWRYGLQLAADDLVRSTDLTNSEFTSRNTASLKVVPMIRFDRGDDSTLELRVGATLDASNRDSNTIGPLAGVSLRTATANGSRSYTMEFAGTSQVPGYTVLGSGPAGLFGGNPRLGREKSQQLLLSVAQEAPVWRGMIAVFYRRDDDLVDWTYASAAPFARQANPVDLDVFGIEGNYTRSWGALDASIGYTYLDKDADYGSALVDASFYALNFARHRATFALRCQLTDRLRLDIDNEYRQQQSNPLRATSAEAFMVSTALSWRPRAADGFEVAITADNLGDDDYQQFPGTPAVGRQISVSVRYGW